MLFDLVHIENLGVLHGVLHVAANKMKLHNSYCHKAMLGTQNKLPEKFTDSNGGILSEYIVMHLYLFFKGFFFSTIIGATETCLGLWSLQYNVPEFSKKKKKTAGVGKVASPKSSMFATFRAPASAAISSESVCVGRSSPSLYNFYFFIFFFLSVSFFIKFTQHEEKSLGLFIYSFVYFLLQLEHCVLKIINKE